MSRRGDEVHVAGPALDRPGDDRVDEPHLNALLVDQPGRGPLCFRCTGVQRDRSEVEVWCAGDQAPQLGANLVDRRDDQLDRMAACETKLVHALEVAGVGDRDPQPAAVEAVRHGPGPLEHTHGNLRRRVRLDLDRGQVDEQQAVCLGELGRAEVPAVARDLAVASRESK